MTLGKVERMEEPATPTNADVGAGSAPLRKRWPLRGYLIGIVALFVAAAAAGIFSAWAQSRSDAVAAARADAAHGAQHAAKQIEDDLDEVRGTVAQLAASTGIRQVFANPQNCELAFNVGGGDGHLDVIRPDGTVVCSSRPPAAAADGHTSAAWLTTAAAGFQLSAPVTDARTGKPAIRITAPVDKLGVVAAFIDLAALGDAIGERHGGTRLLEFLVVDADATIVTRWPDGTRWAGRSARDSPFLASAETDDGLDVTGTRRVYDHADVAGVGWRVHAGAARAPALATASRLASRQAMIAGAGLLIGLAATLLVYRRITRPISRLRGAVRNAAAAGGAPAAVAVRGPREVVELGAEFDKLLSTVDRELTRRRQAEETAHEHERNYRQMFEASPYPIYLFDTETLLIVEANDAAVRYYGHARSQLHGMSVVGLCPPEDGATLIQAAGTAGPVERSRPQRQIRHDGTVGETAVTSHEMSFGGRKVRCAVVEDITEREHLERRLRQSQRLESLGQLAGGIAHDFNNLLGVIVGYAAMSAEDVQRVAQTDPAWHPLHDDLVQIVAAADRATGLTRQLLSFARADVVAELRALDLNSVVADVDKLLRRTIGEDIELIVRLAEDPWPVKADPGQLEQVLLNLAVNARDAMPGGGTLTIDNDAVTVDEHYAAQHPGLRVARYMRLRVSDTGTGMSKATLERAFEPFFTTKPKGDGTGLGLATIYGIVTQAGGNVQIYSEPGHGTTVSALFPVTDDVVGPAAQTPAAAQRGDGETILLVEDDEGLRILTERVLTRHGYRVLAAANAGQAHELAGHHPYVELLVTDVVMPETDGPTMASVLQTTHPDLRVIYVSGYTETVLATRNTLPAGATLLNKPITADHLLTAVARSLHGATAARHPMPGRRAQPAER